MAFFAWLGSTIPEWVAATSSTEGATTLTAEESAALAAKAAAEQAASGAAATAALPSLTTAGTEAAATLGSSQGILGAQGLMEPGVALPTATAGEAAAPAANAGINAVPGQAAIDASGTIAPNTTTEYNAQVNAAKQAAANSVPGQAGMSYQAPNGMDTVNPSYQAGTSSAGSGMSGTNTYGVPSSGILGNTFDPIINGFNDATKMLGTGSDWMEKHKTATTLGLLGLSKLGKPAAQPGIQKPTGQAMDMHLASNFQGYHPQSNTSVYNPVYTQPTQQAAQGGIMQSYASGGAIPFDQGGIAAMAGPQGSMYPQSQQDQTQYATPSQMPTSSSVINAGYEAQTDPYTGEPTKGFNGGGIIAFGAGSLVPQPSQMDTSHISMLGGPSPWSTNQDTDANTAHLAPHEAAAYRQKKLENLISYANRAKTPTAPMGFNQTPVAVQAQQAAQGAAQAQPESMQLAAAGGIMGADHSSLGGYATGGAPRLLKGPGDGMSDNIPAVIANKQPARLADGEFVIPADVVSHLGNGSTDAGAKHLNTMMSNVRKARTGNPKQGKQIDPTKFLPA